MCQGWRGTQSWEGRGRCALGCSASMCRALGATFRGRAMSQEAFRQLQKPSKQHPARHGWVQCGCIGQLLLDNKRPPKRSGDDNKGLLLLRAQAAQGGCSPASFLDSG